MFILTLIYYLVRLLDKVYFKGCLLVSCGTCGKLVLHGGQVNWLEACLSCKIYYLSVSVKPLSERVTLIWSDETKNWFRACQFLLVNSVAKFDKTYLHWCLILYNDNIFKDRSAITNALKLELSGSHKIIVNALQFPTITI